MKNFLAFSLVVLAAANAQAEKADRAKAALLGFESLHVDEVKQVKTMTGNVTITKGTLVLKADKAMYKQTPQKNNQVILIGSDSSPASFRQKRDGGPDLWIEGEAQRIEYDELTNLVKLFTAAHIRQFDGTRLTDEIQSEFISYDSIHEVFSANNHASGMSKPGRGRGKMIIAPRIPQSEGAAPLQAPIAVPPT